MNRRYFLGAALTAMATPALARRAAEPPRALSLHHMHTDEKISVVYREGDHYKRSALQQLNWFLRDFRTGDTMPMDPQLLDLLYDIKASLGDPEARYEILSAYRTPQTNAMLRAEGHGAARNSMHLYGQAIDIRFPDLGLGAIRDAALSLGRGGVGYYPGSNFVHVDTGNVRAWRS
jgi:uncharacterized protein YcbK (DUF882 family)